MDLAQVVEKVRGGGMKKLSSAESNLIAMTALAFANASLQGQVANASLQGQVSSVSISNIKNHLSLLETGYSGSCAHQ